MRRALLTASCEPAVRRALLTAIALALVAPPGATAAGDRHTVTRPVASVRNGPGSFAIGHVFAGAAVDVVAWRRGWAYATWGDGRCGWLMARGLVPTGVATAAACPPPSSLAPRRLFARGTYQLGCGEGCVYPARVVPCADRTAFANYDPARGFADPVSRPRARRGTRGATVPRYAGVRSGYSGFGLRYVTADGVAALIKDSRARGPVWRFIRADCIERLELPVTVAAFARLRPRTRAARAFGDQYTRGAPCRLTWARPAVTIAFRRCRRFARAEITRQRIRGSALVHTWTTPEGLQLGDRVARLRQIYPHARPFRGTYRIAVGVRALIRGGRVDGFRVSASRA